MGVLAVAAAARARLRHRRLRRARALRVPHDRRAVLGRAARHGDLHGHVGGARAAPGRRHRARAARATHGPPHRARVAAAGLGAARRRHRAALRVAISPGGRPRERRAGRRAELARRPGAGAARARPRGRLAYDALRRALLLRAAADDSARGLRGGRRRRRRARRDVAIHHPAVAGARAAGHAAVPHARRAARVRSDVRPHRRWSGRPHRDPDRLRVPQPVPDPSARASARRSAWSSSRS